MFHVLLEGRRMGPYDSRTIVGMRIKKALTSDHVLVGGDGTQLTVRALFEQRRKAPSPEAEQTGTRSVVQAHYTGAVLEVDGTGLKFPRFKGEIEVRVQAGILRIAGTEGRVKIPMTQVVHTRVRGPVADLWLRGPEGARLQRLSLDLVSDMLASELAGWLPDATPYPPEAERAARAAARSPGVVVAVAGVVLAILLVLVVVVLTRR